MARCVICDHSDGHANEYLHRPASGNRVRWNRKTSEFICDECASTIQNTMYSQADAQGEVDYTNVEFLFRHDSYDQREEIKPDVAAE